MLIKKIIKCNFLVVLVGLFLSITNNLKAEGNEFNMGVGFEPQAVTGILELSPVRAGDIIRTSTHNETVRMDLTPGGGAVSRFFPAGYYTVQDGTPAIGIYLISGDNNAIINIRAPVSIDPLPPGLSDWVWLLGGFGNVALDYKGQYFYRLGLRTYFPANSTLSGEISMRFTLEVTGG